MANCKTYTNKINSIQIYFFKGVLGIKGKKKKKKIGDLKGKMSDWPDTV